MNKQSKTRVLASISLLGTLSVAACSSGGATAPTTPTYPTTTVNLNGPTASSSTSAYAGSSISRDTSFSVVLPVGWTPVKSTLPGVMIFVQAPTTTHGVRTNFNVLRQAAPGVSLQDVLDQSRSSLEQSGYTLTIAQPRTIGGLPAQGLLATKTVQKQQVTERQYFVQQGSASYVTTMTSSTPDAAAAESAQTAIFGTWAWKRS
ncbi:MAG: DcrB-related protein [Allobranchiibius sp.]